MRNRDDEILMIHRTGAHGEGTWSFPGGWLVPNETPEDCIRREAWEEVGVNLREVEFIGYTADAHPEGLHGLTLYFLCTDWEGEPRNTNPDRITDIEWWHADRLYHALRDDLFFPLREALDKRLVPC
jgi:8-oxo-dGTP diphosphatase